MVFFFFLFFFFFFFPRMTSTVDELLRLGQPEGRMGRYQRNIAFGICGVGSFLALVLPVIGTVFIETPIADELGMSSGEVGLFGSVFFFGWMLGAVVLNIAADRYGRAPVMWLSLICAQLVNLLLITLATSVPVVLVIRVVSGFFLGGLGAVGYVLMVESVSVEHCNLVTGMQNIVWAIGSIATAVVAYLLRNQNWRVTVAVQSIPAIIILPFMGRVLESPKFLHANGSTEEALAVVVGIERYNSSRSGCWNAGADLSGAGGALGESAALSGRDTEAWSLTAQVDDGAAQSSVGRAPSSAASAIGSISGRRSSVARSDVGGGSDQDVPSDTDATEEIDTVTIGIGERSELRAGQSPLAALLSRKYLAVTLAQFFIWMTASLTFYGLSLGARKLPGSVYLASILLSAVEIPGGLFFLYLTSCRQVEVFRIQGAAFGLCGVGLLCMSIPGRECGHSGGKGEG
jgi:MFS family permease